MQKNDFPSLSLRDARNIPIRKIDFSIAYEKQTYDKIIFLIEVMLNLKEKICISKGSEKDQIQRKIEKTDKEIDDLVYKLYGITAKEKKIIEGEG
jgi:metal-sulfur cluster biosynthetic enzyme